VVTRRGEQTLDKKAPIDARVIRTLLHDVASPLAAIRLSAWTLLSTGTLTPADAAIVRRIERSSRKLVGTVQTMLRMLGPGGHAVRHARPLSRPSDQKPT
jgi:K+-sensing histidine kinase KdpD